MVLLMEQKRGKATKEKPEENRKINPSPSSHHNKRNWNHFIGIETHTIMSKAQQMVQCDHETLPSSHFEPLKKKRKKRDKETHRGKKRRRKIRQDCGREIAWIFREVYQEKGIWRTHSRCTIFRSGVIPFAQLNDHAAEEDILIIITDSLYQLLHYYFILFFSVCLHRIWSSGKMYIYELQDFFFSAVNLIS